ncbi:MULTISPECIES: hypothetical protein [unclassified Microcoleus]
MRTRQSAIALIVRKCDRPFPPNNQKGDRLSHPESQRAIAIP